MATQHEYMQAWVNLSFSGSFLLAKISEEMEAEFGISIVEQEFLGQVGKAGGEIRMTDLARHTWVSKAAVTKIVDRLEERRLVRREPSPTDRRATQVVLASKGRQLLGRTWKALPGMVETHFAKHLSDGDIKALSQILRKFIDSHGLWDALVTRLRGFNK